MRHMISWMLIGAMRSSIASLELRSTWYSLA